MTMTHSNTPPSTHGAKSAKALLIEGFHYFDNKPNGFGHSILLLYCSWIANNTMSNPNEAIVIADSDDEPVVVVGTNNNNTFGGNEEQLGRDPRSAIEICDDDDDDSSDDNVVMSIPSMQNRFHHQEQQVVDPRVAITSSSYPTTTTTSPQPPQKKKRKTLSPEVALALERYFDGVSKEPSSPRSSLAAAAAAAAAAGETATMTPIQKGQPPPSHHQHREEIVLSSDTSDEEASSASAGGDDRVAWHDLPAEHADAHTMILDQGGKSGEVRRQAAVAAAAARHEREGSASSSSEEEESENDHDRHRPMASTNYSSNRKSKPPVKLPNIASAVPPAARKQQERGGGPSFEDYASDITDNSNDKKPRAQHSQPRHSSRPRRPPRYLDDDDDNDDSPLEDRKMPADPTATRSRRKSVVGGSRASMVEEEDADYPTALRHHVEETLRQVRKAHTLSSKELLKQFLIAKNKLLQGGKPRRVQPLPNYRRLPFVENQPLDSSYLRHEDYPLPRDSHHTVFMRKHFSSATTEKDDEEGDDKNKAAPPSPCLSSASTVDGSDSLDGEELSPSKKKYAKQIAEFRLEDSIGVGYEEDEMDAEIDKVLEASKDTKFKHQRVHEYLAILINVDTKRVTKRWQKINGIEEPRRQHNSPYEEVMSSFRDLFCRRCQIFDCNLHGLQDDYDPAIQLELAVRLENSGYWKNEPVPMCLAVGAATNEIESRVAEVQQVESTTVSGEPDDRVLEEDEKELCKRLYQLFQNDLSSVSRAMSIPEASIARQVELERFEFKLSDPTLSSHGKTKQNKSNAYNQEWMKRIVQATSHPFFNPCTHTGQCSEETCSCVQNRFFCTKACIWGASSRNFFRGCNCTSRCQQKSCPCFAANRECDPDLCKKCGACSDPPNKPATEQSCRNDNIAMRRHVHLLLGKSRVAGWGLYNKHALKKGDYIHEYIGELIPHNEAERRGEIYDHRNQTYIFDMSTDYAVDALKKGNKTRYINHSDDPNLEPQMKVVNGDYRIGFFALKDIPAQSELFFDYGDKFFKAKGAFAPQN